MNLSLLRRLDVHLPMRFWAKPVLGLTILFWMIPEIYMLSVALRPP
jgi:hypothetical protein